MQNLKRNKDETRKRRWLTVILLFLILLFIWLCLRACNHELQPEIVIGGEDIKEYQLHYDRKEEMIEIPGLQKEYLLDAKNKELYLVNPEGNTVYFRYAIWNEDGSMIYETAYIPPNKMEKANLYDILEAGEHRLIVKLETVDMENNSACNSAQMKTNVTVNN